MTEAYDPLDYDNLARSVVLALLDRPENPVPPNGPFPGAGVYGMYYHGEFESYQPIVASRAPIYVGKAIPTGARKGVDRGVLPRGSPLYMRLAEHAKSLEQAENLRREDFTCRYLAVVPVWIPLAERFLVGHYRPIWNVVIDGFGNHPPGRGRRDMRRPRWDVVHPGRPWAGHLRLEQTPSEILEGVKAFLEGGVEQ